MRNRYVLDGGYIKNPKEHFKKMLEELIEEEKQVAEGYKEYFAKRPEFKKEMKNLWDSLKNDEITPEEYSIRALEIGKKYR